MLHEFYYTIIVSLLAIVTYIAISINVGRARGRYKVQPPVTTGHPDFERYYRVQMNTLEQMVAFLPALWIFSIIWGSGLVVLIAGLTWIIARILFAIGYYKAAEKRILGFVISFSVTAFLIVGSLVGLFIK
jgi:glutathione S-transferase